RSTELSVAADPGKTVSVTLRLTSNGEGIEGRVLDEDDRPMAGVRLVWTSGCAGAFGLAEPPGPDGDARTREDAAAIARTTSGPDGAFRVRSPSISPLFPVTLDPSLWLVEAGQPVPAPAKDVVLHVTKAWRIEVVDVRGEPDDDPVAWSTLSLWLSTP